MSSAKPRARAAQMNPEQRRQQLLAAGISCIANKGIGATKHADLARACDISVPAVFSYFSNREALVASILNRVGEQLFESVIQPAQAVPEAKERLSTTAPLFIDYARQQPDSVKVWLMWSMHFAPEIQAEYRKLETRLIAALVEMIIAGGGDKLPEDDLHDRALMIIASSAFLAKMVFDGVSEKRRGQFVSHVLQPLSVY